MGDSVVIKNPWLTDKISKIANKKIKKAGYSSSIALNELSYVEVGDHYKIHLDIVGDVSKEDFSTLLERL